jgi:hypothetical protein
MKRINIVYFIWINPKKNYINIISGQLNDLKNSGILDESTLYIEICCEYENLCKDINDMINNIIKDYDTKITFYSENRYEYYGIKKLYDLALEEPDKYYLYFHSKGMFNYDNINERHLYEKSVTKGTICQYKKVLNIFDNNMNVSKIGLFPSDTENFVWLNYFWSRGSYFNTCESPIITNNRFYYETWSGLGEKTSLMYNLHEHNYKKYDLNEVRYILHNLQGQYFLK